MGVGDNGSSVNRAGDSGMRPSRSSAVRPQMFPLFWWMCPDSNRLMLATVAIDQIRVVSVEAQMGNSQNHSDMPAAFVSFCRSARN